MVENDRHSAIAGRVGRFRPHPPQRPGSMSLSVGICMSSLIHERVTRFALKSRFERPIGRIAGDRDANVDAGTAYDARTHADIIWPSYSVSSFNLSLILLQIRSIFIHFPLGC